MCRLVVYAGPPLSVDRPLFDGTHSLLQQSWAPRELLFGSVNADGFGVAWFPGADAEPVRLARTEPAWYDPEVRTLLAAQRSSMCVAALRNATPGLPVERSGLLPMILDGWGFALNGFVPDFRSDHMRALRGPLPDSLYARLQGVSDAETLFLRVVAAIQGGAEPGAALASVVQAVAERLPEGRTAPLTMTLTNHAAHWVVHTNAGVGAVNSLYLTRESAALGPGTALASEPLDGGGGWRAVPPHSVLHITPAGVVAERRLPGRRPDPAPGG